MGTRYQIPHFTAQPGKLVPWHECCEEIKRSLFITRLGHAKDVATARSFIEAIRALQPDATHHCWAFVAGPPGESSPMGYSDDGEPHGTAGKPMLAQLRHSGLGEIVAVITRYYGGVKLGPGGLVRAYQGGVQQALATLPTVWRMPLRHLLLSLNYRHISRVKMLMATFEATSVTEDFQQRAVWRLALPEENAAAFCSAVIDATEGTATVETEYEHQQNALGLFIP